MTVQHLGDHGPAGRWRLFAHAPFGHRVELTTFRDVPMLPDSFTFEDPFGPADMTISMPQVSLYERFGVHDLDWLKKKVRIDLVWDGYLPTSYPFGNWRGRAPEADARWEGHTMSLGLSEGTLQLTNKGGMHQLDDFLAKPEYLHRPLDYVHAIKRQFNHTERPHLRTQPMHILWPDWWKKKYTPPPKRTPGYMIPGHLHKGDNWTGLLTRSTGSWEPALTSYIQTLLQAMYTRHGRWTLDLWPNRQPILLHRPMLHSPDDGTAILDIVSATVVVEELEVDWSQSMDVVFGAGQSLTGVTYSGMQVTNNGQRTFYLPLAYFKQAYPYDKSNHWRMLSDMPREAMLQGLTGLDEYEASQVAQNNLERFGDPGVTGSVTVWGDVPLGSGAVIQHHLVRAGMSVNLKNLLGLKNGLMAHVSRSEHNLVEGNTRLTFDSRYRDQLTVNEVRARGRDSLNISRMLVGGQYNPPVPDMLLPWNYKDGSGLVPYDPMTIKFFSEMPDDELFPWANWTKKHPPHKDGKPSKWHDAYIEIGPASRNANKNWSGRPWQSKKGTLYAIPVRMAQAGSVRLFQMAAYDKHGNVMKVPFHVSFYYNKNISAQSMPTIPAFDDRKTLVNPSPPPDRIGNPGYYPYKHKPYNKMVEAGVSQHYPYVKGAFEQYNLSGTQKGTEVPQPVHTAGLIQGLVYGNDAIKAGYFPRDGRTGKPTGLLVDETVHSFDTSTSGMFNVYVPRGNGAMKDVGMIYVMVYCDAQGPRPVYFLGRFFRMEPGSQGSSG